MAFILLARPAELTLSVVLVEIGIDGTAFPASSSAAAASTPNQHRDVTSISRTSTDDGFFDIFAAGALVMLAKMASAFFDVSRLWMS